MFKLIKIAIIILGIYIGMSCALPWIKFVVFKNSALKVLELSKDIDDSEIVKLLLEKADELNVRITNKNIFIEELEDGNKYTVKYRSIIGFPIVANKLIFDHEFSKFRDKRGE